MGRRRAIWLALAILVFVLLTIAGVLRAVNRSGALREAWRVRIPDAGVGSTSVPMDWALLGQDMAVMKGALDTLRVYGFDGQLRFEFKPSDGGRVDAFCVAPDGGLYIGTTKNYLYAIAPDFKQRWAVHLAASRDWFVSAVIGSDGTIYAMADRGHVYALNPDGTIRWHILVDGVSAMGQPLLGPADTLLCRTKHLELVAVSPRGEVNWRTAPGVTGIDRLVQAGSLTLCPDSLNGRLTALDLNGVVIYSLIQPIGAPLTTHQPLLAARPDGGCYFTSGQLGTGCDLVSVDVVGQELWRVSLKHAASSPVLLPDGRVACLLTPAWDKPSPRTPFNTQLLSYLTGSLDARLCVFNPDGTASVSGPANCMFAVTQLLATPAGEILLLDERGNLRAFKP